MNKRVGPLQRIAVLALLAGVGGCELMNVTIQTDEASPGYFADKPVGGPGSAKNKIEVEFQLWSDTPAQ